MATLTSAPAFALVGTPLFTLAPTPSSGRDTAVLLSGATLTAGTRPPRKTLGDDDPLLYAIARNRYGPPGGRPNVIRMLVVPWLMFVMALTQFPNDPPSAVSARRLAC